jgi:hypothetical protein
MFTGGVGQQFEEIVEWKRITEKAKTHSRFKPQ